MIRSPINQKKWGMILFSVIAVFFLISHFSFLISTALAASQADVTCSRFQYPWCGPGVQDPASLVNRFYQVALGLVGAAAFGVLIYGAILYTVSAGNTSMQGEAREWLKGAFWGVALLLGAYLILSTINPRLVNLENPEIAPLPPPPTTTTTAPTGYTRAAGNVTPIPAGLPVASQNRVCASPPCQVDRELADRLRGFQQRIGWMPASQRIDWQITEAWPPTRVHQNICHQEGTCVDGNFRGNTQPTVQNVRAFIDQARLANLRAVYEVADEGTYRSLIRDGVPHTNMQYLPPRSDGTPQITGPHFSLYL